MDEWRMGAIPVRSADRALADNSSIDAQWRHRKGTHLPRGASMGTDPRQLDL